VALAQEFFQSAQAEVAERAGKQYFHAPEHSAD
jgi:hypothetical protein